MTLLRLLHASLVLILLPSAALAEPTQDVAIAGVSIALGARADFRIEVMGVATARPSFL